MISWQLRCPVNPIKKNVHSTLWEIRPYRLIVRVKNANGGSPKQDSAPWSSWRKNHYNHSSFSGSSRSRHNTRGVKKSIEIRKIIAFFATNYGVCFHIGHSYKYSNNKLICMKLKFGYKRRSATTRSRVENGDIVACDRYTDEEQTTYEIDVTFPVPTPDTRDIVKLLGWAVQLYLLIGRMFIIKLPHA